MERSTHEQILAAAISAAQRTLPRRGILVTAGVPMTAGGVIGLALAYRGLRAPVEIKPFSTWKPDTAPAKRALWQVNRDQVHLSAARGFLWLPAAGTGWVRYRHGLRAGLVWVVFGSVRSLARVVEHRMR